MTELNKLKVIMLQKKIIGLERIRSKDKRRKGRRRKRNKKTKKKLNK